MNLDIEKWELFDFEKVFDIKKGFYNKKPEPSGTGKIPFLGATDSNNGVTEHYTIEEIDSSSKTGKEPNESIEQKLFPGNAVCVTNNGSVGYAYYQNKPFTCSHDVNPLYRLDGQFNKYTGLFVAAVIMYDRYRWGYGRKWRPERMAKSQLKLPILRDNNGDPIIDSTKKCSDYGFTPDWKYMEEYIKTLHYKPITTQIINSEKIELRTEEWKEFLLHKLMKAEMGNGIDAVITTNDNPKYNYVSRNSNGNGVVGFVDEIEGETPFPAGAMSLALGGSYLGSCFIQKKPFYTAQNVAVLQEKIPLSNHIKLFISTLIRNECKIKYQAFGRELNTHFKKDFTIKLPVKHNDNGVIIDETQQFSDEGYIPDWDWIDNYMRSLPYSDRI
ncbi:MAG: restriction endonuclease subunit S [Ruminococcus sp.]|nr:restriction endonuclease subunit S [Ruminococcus sp.]